jgi:hypothetical protein
LLKTGQSPSKPLFDILSRKGYFRVHIKISTYEL